MNNVTKLCMGCMEEINDNVAICPYCGWNESTAHQESYYLSPGTIIGGKYIVGKVLSYQNFTVKYIGMDAEHNRKVMISEYLPSDFSTRSDKESEITIYSGDALEQFNQGLMNFLNEGNVIQQFGSLSGIATVYDCIAENSTGYVISEYLEGDSLKQILDSGKRYQPKDAVKLISSILQGLHQIHKKGIFHCDISPETIFITKDGKSKLMDFGATKYVTTLNSKSLAIILKQGYAPEEQYRSKGERGAWTDVYALAAVMYRMITGKVPQESIERALDDRLEVPSKIGITISPSVENALVNALNIYQNERTATAENFRRELNSSSTKRIKVKKRKKETGKTPVWIKIMAAMVACAVIAGGTFVVKNMNKNSQGTGKSAEPLQYKLGETKLTELQDYWNNNLESNFDDYIDIEYRYVSDRSWDDVVMELTDESESGCMSNGTAADTIKAEITKSADHNLAKLVVASTKYYTFQPEWYERMPSPVVSGTITYDQKAYPGTEAIPGDDRSKPYGVIRTIQVGENTVYDAQAQKEESSKKHIDALRKLSLEEAVITIYTGEYFIYDNKKHYKENDFIGKNIDAIKFVRVHSAGKANEKKTDSPKALSTESIKLLCQDGYYCFNRTLKQGMIISVLSDQLKKGQGYNGIKDNGKLFKLASGSISTGITLQQLQNQGFTISNIKSFSGNLSQYIVTNVKIADKNSKKDQQLTVKGVEYFTKSVPVTVTAEKKVTSPKKESYSNTESSQNQNQNTSEQNKDTKTNQNDLNNLTD